MLRCTVPLNRKMLQAFPVSPVVKHYRRQGTSMRSNPYNRMFWRTVMDENHTRASFWSSDFRHRHLAQTGTDFAGKVPSSPAPGTYQGFQDVRRILGGHPKPQRESRHLPIMPLTPRVVFEHHNEKKILVSRQMRSDRRKVEVLKHQEFWGWYMKLQRVRGRWCKENGVASRGVYGPAVDAAELWG
jgi:hypothetical protein